VLSTEVLIFIMVYYDTLKWYIKCYCANISHNALVALAADVCSKMKFRWYVECLQ